MVKAKQRRLEATPWFPSASCGQKSCCCKRITATAGSRDARQLSRARLQPGKLANGAAGGGEIGQAHLGVFAREDQAISAGFERGGGGGVGVVGRGFARVLAGGDADVNAGKNFAFALHAVEGALGFARDVIG